MHRDKQQLCVQTAEKTIFCMPTWVRTPECCVVLVECFASTTLMDKRQGLLSEPASGQEVNSPS